MIMIKQKKMSKVYNSQNYYFLLLILFLNLVKNFIDIKF